MNIYLDDNFVSEMTNSAVSKGQSIFQIYKFGNDKEHVEKLLTLFNPPSGKLLDVGCGIGKVSELISEKRKDIQCVLLNISQSQLDLCPDMEKIHADFHSIPTEDNEFDSVMFNYSLGHGRLIDGLKEAARVLKTNGVLFIYDIASDNPLSIYESLGYATYSERDVIETAKLFGLKCTLRSRADGSNTDDFLKILDSEIFNALFCGVRPVAYRFVKIGVF